MIVALAPGISIVAKVVALKVESRLLYVQLNFLAGLKKSINLRPVLKNLYLQNNRQS
jgi:hypothetical protein